MITRTPGFCALCRSRCGSISVVEDGKFIAQEPNPAHPTGRALCVKGRAAAEIVNSPQRLLYPMMRTTPKGSGDPGWKRISWDEALDRVAASLSKIRAECGPEGVAFSLTSPSGAPISDGMKWIERLVNAAGSPNSIRGTEICNWHKDFGHAYTFGRGIASPDFTNAKCILLWGHNPTATWLDHATAVAAASSRGVKIIVVDPKRVGFAARAHQWLRVRPGSDEALALGIAGEMIRNSWFDEAFMRQWSNGPLLVRPDTGRFVTEQDLDPAAQGRRLIAWDGTADQIACYDPATGSYDRPVERIALTATIDLDIDGARLSCRTAFGHYADRCAQYPPERVEELCWVPAEQVRETARLIFENGPVCYYAWSGLAQHANAAQIDRALALLYALTGSFDAPGGNVDFAHVPSRDIAGNELMPDAQRRKCVSLGDHPLGPARKGWIGSDAFYRTVLSDAPYPIRGLVGFGANLVMSHANPQLARQALEKLEFFVHADVQLTPTMEFADVVLPVNTPWEREALRIGFEVSQDAEELVQLRPAMVEPAGESRSDAWIAVEIAKRLGLAAQFWDGDIDAGLRYALEPAGVSLEALRADPSGIRVPLSTVFRKYAQPGSGGFATPSKKIEVYSEVFLAHGYEPIPGGGRAAPAREDFPLTLTSAKVAQYCHSQHRHVPSLRQKMPEPLVHAHPDTAQARGLQDGDWVYIVTPHGRVKMKLSLDAQLDPRVVSAQYGWWQSSEPLGMPTYPPLSEDGANYNFLIGDDAIDPISGAAPHRSYLCNLARA